MELLLDTAVEKELSQQIHKWLRIIMQAPS